MVPAYFNALKFKSAVIKTVGEGHTTVSLARQAEQITSKGSYTEIWYVFDKDNFPAESFKKAITLAKAKGFHVAYSNQAFEFWIILHFNDHQGWNTPSHYFFYN